MSEKQIAVLKEELADARNRSDELCRALKKILLMRKAGPTPKLVSGKLVEQIEEIAMRAIFDKEKEDAQP